MARVDAQLLVREEPQERVVSQLELADGRDRHAARVIGQQGCDILYKGRRRGRGRRRSSLIHDARNVLRRRADGVLRVGKAVREAPVSMDSDKRNEGEGGKKVRDFIDLDHTIYLSGHHKKYTARP